MFRYFKLIYLWISDIDVLYYARGINNIININTT